MTFAAQPLQLCGRPQDYWCGIFAAIGPFTWALCARPYERRRLIFISHLHAITNELALALLTHRGRRRFAPKINRRPGGLGTCQASRRRWRRREVDKCPRPAIMATPTRSHCRSLITWPLNAHGQALIARLTCAPGSFSPARPLARPAVVAALSPAFLPLLVVQREPGWLPPINFSARWRS